VSDAHLRDFSPEPTLQDATIVSHWQRVGDLISSGFEPIPPAPEADILALVPIGRCYFINCFVTTD